jgi:transcription antitermination factor NusA-like protein
VINIRACIIEVKNNPKDRRFIIPGPLRSFWPVFLMMEVPEIFAKTFEYCKSRTEPGHAKIAVTTVTSGRILWSLCGNAWYGYRANVRELSNERYDIINMDR